MVTAKISILLKCFLAVVITTKGKYKHCTLKYCLVVGENPNKY